jgi:hypothetical protein
LVETLETHLSFDNIQCLILPRMQEYQSYPKKVE